MSNFLDNNLNHIWSSVIIRELLKNNITQFYISPGMRNAPLIAALKFYQNINNNFTVHICIDERSASYRALGFSKATGKASVLLCTSGTALANYYPAVIEADKTNIPLIIISADRPHDQVNSGDNQTINQKNIYSNFVRTELDTGVPTIDISVNNIATSISNLIFRATTINPGPVHLNCPFREPLDSTPQTLPTHYLNDSKVYFDKENTSTHYLPSSIQIDQNALRLLAEKISSSKKGILVIGSLFPSMDLEKVRSFIKKLNWQVFLDVSSSLKYEFSLKDNSIPTFDHPEVLTSFSETPPDTIIHIGGRLTSKHYYSLINKLSNTELITINNTVEKEDPCHKNTVRIVADIGFTLDQLSGHLKSETVSTKYNINFESFVHNKRKIIEDAPLSYPVISKKLIESLPNHSLLYIANSTIVRSFDSYSSIDDQKHFTIATNRGVSGIEGFIASACGFAEGKKQSVYLVVGDISFMHDLNSLYYLKDLKVPLKIILINNFSGGIFTLLPINQDAEVLSVITSPHNENFNSLAQSFKLHYRSVNQVSELSQSISDLEHESSHCLLEIFVDNEQNLKVYEQLKTINQ